MNILVIGQSHVGAIRTAARARREREPDRPRTRVIHTLEPHYAPEIVGEGGEIRFAPALADAIGDQIARHDPLVASVMGGNVHNALALLRHPRPFDFHLSGEPSGPIDAAAELLPEALVRAALEEGLARDIDRLRLLRTTAGPFVHLESPPPVRDDGFIRARADAWFADRAGPVLHVAPAALRHRIWRLNARIVRAAVEALGCRVLPVPAEARDADGFLPLHFAGDATHGNGAYGELAIRALEVDAGAAGAAGPKQPG